MLVRAAVTTFVYRNIATQRTIIKTFPNKTRIAQEKPTAAKAQQEMTQLDIDKTMFDMKINTTRSKIDNLIANVLYMMQEHFETSEIYTYFMYMEALVEHTKPIMVFSFCLFEGPPSL